MITIKTYRGHIRNWEALSKELGLDVSAMTREEREQAIVIKAYDADSWQDTGIPYANRARSVFRTPDDSNNENRTYKINLSQGVYEYTKTVGGGTIVVMDNIPVGPWKITCRAYKSDGTLEYMGSTDAEVIANETVDFL